jgi:hypothetical protein
MIAAAGVCSARSSASSASLFSEGTTRSSPPDVCASARISASSAGIGAIKTALRLLGVIESDQVAEPLVQLDQAETDTIEGVLVENGLLRAVL